MKAIRLVAFVDEYDRTPGLIIKGTRHIEGLMADRDGLLIAHDLIEHPNGPEPMGDVWDELEACGGIWHVRGRWGDLMTPSMHSAEINVASDVTRMFPEWVDQGRYYGPGGLGVGSRPHLYDDEFAEIISIARHDIPREYNGEHGAPESSPELIEEYLTLALHRMRSGFRKCERRFPEAKRGRFASNSQFRAVKDAVEHVIKYELDWEGQEFILSYGNGEATCRPDYSEEY